LGEAVSEASLPKRLVLGPTFEMQYQIEQAAQEAHERYLKALNRKVAVQVAGFMELPDDRDMVSAYLKPCEGVFSSGGDPYDMDALPDELPAFTTDLNVCAQLEFQVLERGLGEAYVQRLSDITSSRLLLAMAPAYQRCEAMLYIIERGT
jgi:hypothetical protein